MNTLRHLGITVLLCMVGANSAQAQMSYSMMFTTGATGHHESEGTQVQQSQTVYSTMSFSSDSPALDQKATSKQFTRSSKQSSYQYEDVKSFNSEQGYSNRTTQIRYQEEYDFNTYDFNYSLEFDY